MDEKKEAKSFILSDVWYKRLRHIQLLVPVTGTAYFLFAVIWDWSSIKEVVATSTVISSFVGVAISISETLYDKSDAKYDGDMVVQDSEDGTIIYTLELNRDAGEFKSDKSIRFRVVHKQVE